jgi:hypothetical protein
MTLDNKTSAGEGAKKELRGGCAEPDESMRGMQRMRRATATSIREVYEINKAFRQSWLIHLKKFEHQKVAYRGHRVEAPALTLCGWEHLKKPRGFDFARQIYRYHIIPAT